MTSSDSHTSSVKTGYLTADFRIFYLTSTDPRDFQTHYHDFHKLLFFESGNVSYYVEGETYELQPFDFVFVTAGEVHRPVIRSDAPYRRLILYLSPDFFDQYKTRDCDLFRCFSTCSGHHSHVLRLHDLPGNQLYSPLKELIHITKNAAEKTKFAAALYQKSILLQFFILLNRAFDGNDLSCPPAASCNAQVLAALNYINLHLAESLPIDDIADACFLNRSYLMHLFRRETGSTLGAYITEKRLFAARTLIQSGLPVTEAALQSGFSSYVSFYRAYRQKFHDVPKNCSRLRL